MNLKFMSGAMFGILVFCADINATNTHIQMLNETIKEYQNSKLNKLLEERKNLINQIKNM